MISDWIQAFRLRTLPLSLSTIGMGGVLAAYYNAFHWNVFLACCSTTLFLQILSNIANDYGDSVHGADRPERVGPTRAVQSGRIHSNDMKRAMGLFALLSFVSGIYLLFLLIQLLSLTTLGIFLLLGIAAIFAAIRYTAGDSPYGYKGLGDIFVFLFFGWVAVMGTFFLQVGHVEAMVWLPASTMGFFSTGVLNVNNLRDIESDPLAGKKTIPVRIGWIAGKWYQTFLIFAGWACAGIYWILTVNSPIQIVSWLSLPLFIRHLILIWKQDQPKGLDPYLKQLAMSTLFFVLSFGLGILLG
ncbi:MAG: 1,4-dihydroxy-2-naphthoate polyprenyltransferase [Cytophagaceae bacterium]|nr:1,4-dihydroxy-2-naphthoate polyprenyltransferase [Cytophagaceae bacterium]